MDTESNTYGIVIRSAHLGNVVFFEGATKESFINAANLPADFTEIVVEGRAWTDDGDMKVSAMTLLSVPENMLKLNKPGLVGAENTYAPKLTSEMGFIVSGASAEIKWSDIGAERYEISISRKQRQKRGSVNLFVDTTDKTSALATGLPADCSLVYIHLEAYMGDNKWRRNSYAIYNVPEEYRRNKGVCGSKYDSAGQNP
jgi:hypothetical protein